jgi:hypothetical protein
MPKKLTKKQTALVELLSSDKSRISIASSLLNSGLSDAFDLDAHLLADLCIKSLSIFAAASGRIPPKEISGD